MQLLRQKRGLENFEINFLGVELVQKDTERNS